MDMDRDDKAEDEAYEQYMQQLNIASGRKKPASYAFRDTVVCCQFHIYQFERLDSADLCNVDKLILPPLCVLRVCVQVQATATAPAFRVVGSSTGSGELLQLPPRAPAPAPATPATASASVSAPEAQDEMDVDEQVCACLV
jgi:hypothetical protein